MNSSIICWHKDIYWLCSKNLNGPGGRVVNALALYTTDAGSKPAGTYIYFCVCIFVATQNDIFFLREKYISAMKKNMKKWKKNVHKKNFITCMHAYVTVWAHHARYSVCLFRANSFPTPQKPSISWRGKRPKKNFEKRTHCQAYRKTYEKNRGGRMLTLTHRTRGGGRGGTPSKKKKKKKKKKPLKKRGRGGRTPMPTETWGGTPSNRMKNLEGGERTPLLKTWGEHPKKRNRSRGKTHTKLGGGTHTHYPPKLGGERPAKLCKKKRWRGERTAKT